MKFVNRIFLVLGAMSMFSLVQFDAMAKCSDTPDAGEYCGGTSVKDCIPGCYCVGGNKNAVGVTENNLKNFCTEKQSANTNQTDKMNQAGIYLCSNSAQFSKEKAVSSLDCKDVEWCNKQPDSGKYCERKYKTSGSGSVIKSCPDGCWCEGKAKGQKAVGILNPFSSTGADTIPLVAWCGRTGSNRVHNLESYLNERGIHYCPDDFPHSDNASEKVTNCYAKANETEGFGKMYYGQVTCTPGYFLKKGTGRAGLCIQCTSGSYCEGGTFIVSYKEDQGIESCPGGYSSGPAATKITDCKNASGQNYVVPSGGSNLRPVAAQRVDASDLVAWEALCVNGQSHKVYFFRGAGNAAGTMNPVNKCTDDTVTLPSSGFTRADYQFDEWNCDNNIGPKVAGETFPMPNANVTCTARWTAVPLGTYTVQYLCGDGFGIAPVDNSSYAHNDSVTLKSNTCTAPSGDTFYKWSCDNGIGTQAENATFYMPNANVTCTAQWTQTPIYTIILRNYDNSGTHSTIYEKYGTGWYSNAAATTTLNAATVPTRSNYTFRGYYTAAQTDLTASGGSGTRHITNSGGLPSNTTFSANTNLYAAWARNCDAETGCNCTLTVNNDGTVTYTTSAQTGYTLTSGDGTYHPVCTLTVNTADCNPGQYLLANTSTCVPCQDGYGCSGGTFEIKNSDQGREQCMPDRVSCQNYSACCYCPDGSNPNDTYSGCVNSNGTVVLPEDPDDPVPPVSCTTPGKYWNGDYCENCESGYFCPGDGDEYRCPLSGTTTTNRASCKLNVSKTQMYGNNGNKCWKYTGVSRASDYRDCVYGDHLESYPH